MYRGRGFRFTGRGFRRCFVGKIRITEPKHLIVGLVVGDQTRIDQIAAGMVELVALDLQPPAQRLISVVAHAVLIADDDQDQIEPQRVAALTGIDVAVFDQTRVDPAKGPRGAASKTRGVQERRGLALGLAHFFCGAYSVNAALPSTASVRVPVAHECW